MAVRAAPRTVPPQVGQGPLPRALGAAGAGPIRALPLQPLCTAGPEGAATDDTTRTRCFQQPWEDTARDHAPAAAGNAAGGGARAAGAADPAGPVRSEEHTSELQSRGHL